MNRAALSTLIAQLGGVPSVERMAILQEILDALADRIESLERQVRSLRLQARAGKVFSGPVKISVGDDAHSWNKLLTDLKAFSHFASTTRTVADKDRDGHKRGARPGPEACNP